MRGDKLKGPLAGFKVIEMAGIGPGPFCAMMLADMGAQVIRIDRLHPGFLGGGGTTIDRGRRSIALDIKKPGAAEVVLRLIQDADALIEGFRPGVMERLGLGPDICLQQNPRLIYGRMTGWGQTGPLASAAGHDINYLSITGALHAMGHADRPPAPPLHLVGDLGGGGMMLAYGIVCGLLETSRSGQGQIIDAAVCDGVATLASAYFGMLSQGTWTTQREANTLDGGAPFYGCYRCKDDRFVSIGPIEPQFYQQLLTLCAIDDPAFNAQWDQKQWPILKQALAKMFATKTRDEWCALLEGTDACFSPVLDFDEALTYPHNVERQMFVTTEGQTHPAPSPRMSRTPSVAASIAQPGAETLALLREAGYTENEIVGLRERGAIA